MTHVELAALAEAVHVLSRTLRRSGELQVGLESLPPSEFEVLQHVVTHPGTSVSSVALALRLRTSNVSTTVGALVRRGLLERVTDPADQRRSLLHPSSVALDHRRLLEAAWERSIAAALTVVDPADAAAVYAALPALTRLAEALTAPRGGRPLGRRARTIVTAPLSASSGTAPRSGLC